MVSDMMRILDESMKLVNKKIAESKEEHERQAYQDYMQHVRNLGVSVYTLIGKMRMDRVLDPKELETLDQMGPVGLKIAGEPCK